MKSLQLVAVAAFTILTLAACGESSTASSGGTATNPASSGGTATNPASSGGTATTPASSAGTVDMCALLSPADLNTVTGADYGAGALDSVGRCQWVSSGVDVFEQVVAYTHTLSLSTFKSDNPGGVDVTVSGHAGYRISSGGIDRIWVDVDGRTLVLSYTPFLLGPESQAIAQELAEIAIGNM